MWSPFNALWRRLFPATADLAHLQEEMALRQVQEQAEEARQLQERAEQEQVFEQQMAEPERFHQEMVAEHQQQDLLHQQHQETLDQPARTHRPPHGHGSLRVGRARGPALAPV